MYFFPETPTERNSVSFLFTGEDMTNGYVSGTQQKSGRLSLRKAAKHIETVVISSESEDMNMPLPSELLDRAYSSFPSPPVITF